MAERGWGAAAGAGVATAGGRGRGVPREEKGGAGRRGAAGTRRAAECALLAGSGKSGLKAAPLLSPACLPPPALSSLPAPPPLSALPGRGLPAGARRDGTRDGRAPRGRRGRAEGCGPAAGWRALGRGGGRKRRTPAPDSAVGRRARAEGEGKRLGPPGTWRPPGGARSLERGSGDREVRCVTFVCLLALHEGFVPQSLPLLFST